MSPSVAWTIFLPCAGAAVGALLVWSFLRSKVVIERERANRLQNERDALEEVRRHNDALRVENAELRKDREAEAGRTRWLEAAETKLRDAFSSLAASALQNNTRQFLQQSRDQVDQLLKQVRGDWGTHREELKGLVSPLEKTLEKLDAEVREMERKREGAYQGLFQQVSQLGRAHQDLQSATSSLTEALRSSTRIRGRWGELQLRRIAEMAGMADHVDFEEQAAGEQGRPDMIVHLPNEGVLPVDAKVPMEAYLDAVEQKDETIARQKLAEHARVVRGHMRTLSGRAYQSQFPRTPDFVVMLVPYESGLAAAFHADQCLLQDALDNKVLVVSPVTLFALLKSVAYGWLQWTLSDNAKRIAEEGQVLYDRLRVFAEHLGTLGKRLDSGVEAYNAAVGSLVSRVFPSAGRLREMGAGASELSEPEPVETRPRTLEGAVPEDPGEDA